MIYFHLVKQKRIFIAWETRIEYNFTCGKNKRLFLPGKKTTFSLALGNKNIYCYDNILNEHHNMQLKKI